MPIKRYENTRSCSRCRKVKAYEAFTWIAAENRYSLECRACTTPRRRNIAFDVTLGQTIPAPDDCWTCPLVASCRERLRDSLWLHCETPTAREMWYAYRIGGHSAEFVQELSDRRFEIALEAGHVQSGG